ncbi:O-antigen ligase family protein [Tissierella praeacuta]|uniref:O-antigen ligase family protein n=1 Tax=Tissierella praeacuta TaxID=43131 RepID=UPI003DA5F67F
MDIRKAIKGSFLFNLIIGLKKLSDNSFLFRLQSKTDNKRKHKPEEYKTWMDISFIYMFFMNLDNRLMRMEEFIFQSLMTSRILSPFIKVKREKTDVQTPIRDNSYLYKIIRKIKGKGSWLDLLIFIPASYFVIDFVIRRTRGLAVLGSIWDELALIVLTLYIIAKRLLSGGKIKHNFTPMDLPAIIYIVMGICHVLIIAPNLGIAIEGFRAVFQHILWYFIATQFIRSIEDSERVINLMLSIGLFMGIHAVYQYIARVPMPGNWVDTTENIRTRAFSIVGSPNILGVIFVLFIPIAISMFLTHKNKYMKIFYFCTTGFMTLGLLLTLSRGAWLAFALAMFIFIIALNPRLIVPFMAFVGIFILFGGSLSQRLLFMLSPVYLVKSAAGGRLYRWDIGIKMWHRNRLFGVGLGRFGGAVAINNQLAPFYLDNYYLKTLTEMGVYGIVGLAFVIICFIISSIKIIKYQNDTKNRIVAIGLFSGAMGVLAQNFVENIFEVPAMIIYFWIAVALINTFAPQHIINGKGALK